MVVTAARNPLAEMGFEDDYAYQTGSYGSSTSHLDVTRYGLGARGGTGFTHGTPPLVPPTLWLVDGFGNNGNRFALSILMLVVSMSG